MNHYIYNNKGHNLINNIECKKKREMFALYIYIPFIFFTFHLSFLEPEQEIMLIYLKKRSDLLEMTV